MNPCPRIYMEDAVPTPRPGQEPVAAALAAMKTPAGSGLYIHGETGRGKSFLAGRWAWRYFSSTARAKILWVDWRQLVRDARSRYRNGEAGDKANDAIDAAINAQVIVLDDFGAGRMTDAVEDLADELFDHRYTHRLFTVVTSNLPLVATNGGPSVKAMFGDRVFSRVAGLCNPVMVGGDDGRLV
mgnify:FL=1